AVVPPVDPRLGLELELTRRVVAGSVDPSAVPVAHLPGARGLLAGDARGALLGDLPADPRDQRDLDASPGRVRLELLHDPGEGGVALGVVHDEAEPGPLGDAGSGLAGPGAGVHAGPRGG